jgi:hypothetical protein
MQRYEIFPKDANNFYNIYEINAYDANKPFIASYDEQAVSW